jgi:hypothetical protein
MPVKTRKITSGKNKGKYSVSTPGGVKAKATTKKKAEAQARLIRAIDHGFKPKKRK